MEKFAMFAKIVAKPGQRDAMVACLKETARLLSHFPGCDLYVVNISPTEPDAIWVYEAWDSEADHDASLKIDTIQELIVRARPLVASSGDNVKMLAIGGKGLSG